MSTFLEYPDYDGLGLAELVRTGQVSCKELLDTAIERIEKLNPRLNAVITPMYELAEQSLDKGLPDGPFTGVPFLLKDLLAAYRGVRLASGSRAFKNYVPDYDSELVRRFKKAGLVILGKTNTPEFGLMGITEPELFGPTLNPWDPGRTPGGSSGGTAAAVSSRMVPLASGGDGGGSIRIPSSFCGLFGMKPTRFRTPTGPKHGRLWQAAAIEHVLTRSVRDSAAMLDATAGPDTGAPFTAPEFPGSFLDQLGKDPGKLKVAFSVESPIGRKVDPECVDAVNSAAKLLEELGHEVEEASPEIDGRDLADSFFKMYFGEVAADIREAEKMAGKKLGRESFEQTTLLMGMLGRQYSAEDFVTAIRKWDLAARETGRFHESYDVYLTPTVAGPPARIGELLPKWHERGAISVIMALGLSRAAMEAGVIERNFLDTLARTPFTQLANLTGQPSMSVPLFEHESGLPLGVLFTAAYGREDLLYCLAGQLERARPWIGRKPGLC